MYRIDIQEGHVGRKTGATGAPGEMAFNDAMGDLIKSKLLLLSSQTLDIHLWPAEFPLGIKGDVFLALHCDGSTSPNARGFSVGHAVGSKPLAVIIEKEYARASGIPFKGYNYTIDEAHYYGFGHGSWRGEVLIEFGFRTNEIDRSYMDSHKDLIATTLAKAILMFLKVPVKTATVTTITPAFHELRWGDKGEQVKVVQRLLNAKINAFLKIDGDFGQQVAETVKRFQVVKKIKASGRVDLGTWNELKK